jgi:hypothetical protein
MLRVFSDLKTSSHRTVDCGAGIAGESGHQFVEQKGHMEGLRSEFVAT